VSRAPEPDHRWRVIQKLATRPTDLAEAEVWDHAKGHELDTPGGHALDLYRGTARYCLQGWLLTKATDAEIATRTRCPEEILWVYRHVFFDVSVFRHHFDVISWIKSNGLQVDATDARYMFWGILYGAEAVAYLSGLPCEVSPVDVQKMAMTDGHFRSLMGRDHPIDSKIAKEAMKHRALALVAAEKLTVLEPSNGQDFAIKLKHRELTATLESVANKDDAEILH
jgi:hypothetical protein